MVRERLKDLEMIIIQELLYMLNILKTLQQINSFDVSASLGGLDFKVEIMDDSAKQGSIIINYRSITYFYFVLILLVFLAFQLSYLLDVSRDVLLLPFTFMSMLNQH